MEIYSLNPISHDPVINELGDSLDSDLLIYLIKIIIRINLSITKKLYAAYKLGAYLYFILNI